MIDKIPIKIVFVDKITKFRVFVSQIEKFISNFIKS